MIPTCCQTFKALLGTLLPHLCLDWGGWAQAKCGRGQRAKFCRDCLQTSVQTFLENGAMRMWLLQDLSFSGFTLLWSKSAQLFLPHTQGSLSDATLPQSFVSNCGAPYFAPWWCMAATTGKKLMAVRIVKHAFEIIHLLTDKKSHSGPSFDAVKKRGGTSRRFHPSLAQLVWCADKRWMCSPLASRETRAIYPRLHWALENSAFSQHQVHFWVPGRWDHELCQRVFQLLRDQEERWDWAGGKGQPLI